MAEVAASGAVGLDVSEGSSEGSVDCAEADAGGVDDSEASYADAVVVEA